MKCKKCGKEIIGNYCSYCEIRAAGNEFASYSGKSAKRKYWPAILILIILMAAFLIAQILGKRGKADPELAKEWYREYNLFCRTNGEDNLEVICQNDVMLWIAFDGSNGEEGDWLVRGEADAIGENGELIYNDVDFVMTYYPDNSHLYIETGNDIYDGEYCPKNTRIIIRK